MKITHKPLQPGCQIILLCKIPSTVSTTVSEYSIALIAIFENQQVARLR